MEYLLWGISYTNVQMLLADAVQVYYGDIGSSDNKNVISADDPRNAEFIMKMAND
ncbi:MAG: hypothetical protein LBK45_02940 [Tannerellaceae bacterium]|nr:hypothetical protein [Tannerellaceae bacterium]